MKKPDSVPYWCCDRCDQKQHAGGEEEEDSNPENIVISMLHS